MTRVQLHSSGGVNKKISGGTNKKTQTMCAKRKEIKTAFDSRSIAPESLHETMFREHFSGELKL
jgi:hypothetical protein